MEKEDEPNIHDIKIRLSGGHSVDIVVVGPHTWRGQRMEETTFHITRNQQLFPLSVMGNTPEECAKSMAKFYRELIKEIECVGEALSPKAKWKKATHKTRGGTYEVLGRADDAYHVREFGKKYEGDIVTGSYMRAEFVLL